MPLKKGKGSVGPNIEELRKGPQYSRTKKKFGKKKAEAQALAIALREAGVSKARARPRVSAEVARARRTGRIPRP